MKQKIISTKNYENMIKTDEKQKNPAKIKDNFILSLSRKGLCSDANAIPFFYDI